MTRTAMQVATRRRVDIIAAMRLWSGIAKASLWRQKERALVLQCTEFCEVGEGDSSPGTPERTKLCALPGKVNVTPN